VPGYDAAGNMIVTPQPGSETTGLTCVFDAWNRLTEVECGTTVYATYAYDCGVLGQTKNECGFYYGTRGALALSTVTILAAGGLAAGGYGGGLETLNGVTGGGGVLWSATVPSEAAIAAGRAVQAAQDLDYLETQLAELEEAGMGGTEIADSMRQAIETAREQIAFWRTVAGG
jgi:hypothetical protein